MSKKVDIIWNSEIKSWVRVGVSCNIERVINNWNTIYFINDNCKIVDCPFINKKASEQEVSIKMTKEQADVLYSILNTCGHGKYDEKVISELMSKVRKEIYG